MKRYDIAVVGGGTAGLVTAFGAAGVGARVVLVERERTGGDCLWTGCVPSKSLIAAAELAHRIRTADAVGLPPREPEIDFAAVMGRVRAAQAQIAPHDSPERLRREGVEVLHGDATFASPGRLDVDGRTFAFRTAVIATGSEPAVPPIEGLHETDSVTTDELWELDALPKRLVVLGGGAVGCELAQAFARLGSRVTIVETADSLLPVEEPEAGGLLAERFEGERIGVRVGATATRVEDGPDRRLVIERAGSEERLPFDRVLVSTGRQPVTADLGLNEVGVEVNEKRAVEVDSTLRTSVAGVFAAGDVTGALPFTHVAAQHGRLVVPNALFHARRRFDGDAIPWVTFTDPEIARVGHSDRRQGIATARSSSRATTMASWTARSSRGPPTGSRSSSQTRRGASSEPRLRRPRPARRSQSSPRGCARAERSGTSPRPCTPTRRLPRAPRVRPTSTYESASSTTGRAGVARPVLAVLRVLEGRR